MLIERIETPASVEDEKEGPPTSRTGAGATWAEYDRAVDASLTSDDTKNTSDDPRDVGDCDVAGSNSNTISDAGDPCSGESAASVRDEDSCSPCTGVTVQT